MINYFIKLPKIKLIMFVFLVPILWNLIISLISTYIFDINISDHQGNRNYNLFMLIFLIVIFGPLYETLVYQFLVIEIFRILFEKMHRLLLVLLSGFMFGIVHYNNSNSFLYGSLTFIMGLYFAFIYEIFNIRKDIKSSILLVALVHSSVNLSGLLFSLIISLVTYFSSH